MCEGGRLEQRAEFRRTLLGLVRSRLLRLRLALCYVKRHARCRGALRHERCRVACHRLSAARDEECVARVSRKLPVAASLCATGAAVWAENSISTKALVRTIPACISPSLRESARRRSFPRTLRGGEIAGFGESYSFAPLCAALARRPRFASLPLRGVRVGPISETPRRGATSDSRVAVKKSMSKKRARAAQLCLGVSLIL